MSLQLLMIQSYMLEILFRNGTHRSSGRDSAEKVHFINTLENFTMHASDLQNKLSRILAFFLLCGKLCKIAPTQADVYMHAWKLKC